MRDFTQTSEWMKPDPLDADIVVSSRVRAARNLEGERFPGRMQEPEMTALANRIRDWTRSETFRRKAGVFEYYFMEELDKDDRVLLLEKHLISPRHLAMSRGRAVALGHGDAVSIMINEEDHLRIQGFAGGLRVAQAASLVRGVDLAMEEGLSFAFSERWGYLTSCPSNVGTGLRASVMLHLPALTMSRRVEELARDIARKGFAIRGYYGEGTAAAGDLYQLSNQRTLGPSEEDIVERTEKLARETVVLERTVRQDMIRDQRDLVTDRVWRALGTLKYARLLPSEEALDVLSRLRLGAGLGLDLPLGLSMGQLNRLTVDIQAGHMGALAGQARSSFDRDRFRADYLRRVLLTGAEDREEKEESHG